MTLKEAALEWARLGYKLFPCVPRTKIPAIAEGLYGASADAALIEKWWTENPDYNIGLPCGEANGITAIDVDPAKGGLDSLIEWWPELAQGAPFTISPTDGTHYVLSHSPGIRNLVGFKPGLDIRNDGGYIMVGPSVHPNGGTYKTYPDQKSGWNVACESFLQNYKKQATDTPRNEGGLVPEGGRNAYLTSLAGSMQRKGMSLEALEAALLAENETALEIPLPEWEVRSIVKSISRYTPEAPASADVQGMLAPPEARSGDLLSLLELQGALTSYLSDKDKVKGLPTGLQGLDALLGGGKRLGEVTCWHAEAKTGKNTLWHYLMYLMLEQNIPLAYASRELSPAEEVVPNLLSVALGENTWLAEVTPERLDKFGSKLSAWPLFFSHGYGFFAPQDIRAWVQKAKAAGVSYFWFDHLHYMVEDPEDHKAASKLIKDLKSLAKTENIHIDIIIQPNKLMDGQRLSLNSIKGGSAMGQAIDNLLILERVKGTPNIAKLTLEVARSKLCTPGSIYLQYDRDSMRFGETEPELDGTSTPITQEAPTPEGDSPMKAAERMIRRSFDSKSLSTPITPSVAWLAKQNSVS